MPQRNSPNAITHLGDLTQLHDIVYDKRSGQRAAAKKSRRNRHYEKQFIRNSLAHKLPFNQDDELSETASDALPNALGD